MTFHRGWYLVYSDKTVMEAKYKRRLTDVQFKLAVLKLQFAFSSIQSRERTSQISLDQNHPTRTSDMFGT